MKRFIVGLIIGFLLATAIGATASSNIRLVVNGREIETDVPPQLINGRVMVPARFVAEPLGATVEWDEDSGSVIITSKINNITYSEHSEWVPLRQIAMEHGFSISGTMLEDESIIINGEKFPMIIVDGQILIRTQDVDRIAVLIAGKTSLDSGTRINLKVNGVNTGAKIWVEKDDDLFVPFRHIFEFIVDKFNDPNSGFNPSTGKLTLNNKTYQVEMIVLEKNVYEKIPLYSLNSLVKQGLIEYIWEPSTASLILQ